MKPDRVIDLRSDTVTQPTPEMRHAMAHAEVGDDVFGDDPTVNQLQEQVATLMGKEAALFMPSGSMANQTAIRAQTQPGDEILAHADSHIYHYEGGAPFALSGCSIQLLPGERGLFDPQELRRRMRPMDSHFAQSRLVIVENTHNRGGGSVWPLEQVAEVRAVADELGLSVHLDGARLMNACVATGHKPADYAQYADTVSICFSKGLGAPVGSAVASTTEIIARVHRFRKMFGGGMRQAGILAAGAIYALDHHVDRLADDHVHARQLAEALATLPGVTVNLDAIETNIVYFDVDERHGSADALCDRLDGRGVRMLALTPQRVRLVTHLHITDEAVANAIEILRRELS